MLCCAWKAVSTGQLPLVIEYGMMMLVAMQPITVLNTKYVVNVCLYIEMDYYLSPYNGPIMFSNYGFL
jgi:hypothetical protein